ncbi:MAG: amidohydrolase family protein [Candidatus Riflebacteria bacterium]|nr:amidohydrolase family protein [Candidatus Riflebacteria bacterium]
MPQLLFYNFSGRNLPDYSQHTFDSMLVEHGLIIKAGYQLRAPHPDVKQINLKNATVFAAFADAHVHLTQTGIALSGAQLEPATNLNEVSELLSAEALNNEFVLGWGLQETRLKECRLPTSEELDRVCPGKFVWTARQDLHSAVLNSVALKWARTIVPDLQARDGLISGNFYNLLSYRLIDKLPDKFKKLGLELAQKHCFKKGVATVHALEGSDTSTADTLAVAEFSKKNALHTVIYHQSGNPTMALEHGWKGLGGCLLADGSLGTRTAALHEAYADAPDCLGNLYLKANEIRNLLETTRQHQLHLALHAIGDRAIDLVTSCYAWACDKLGKSPMPDRIEHFIMPSDKAIRQAREHAINICIQPAFDKYWGGSGGLYEQRLGKERAFRLNPFKTMLDLGIQLAAGSDSPVTSIDPISGIAALLHHSNPEERLSLNSALSLFISEPHKLAGESLIRGHLKTGYHADFICLNHDPFKRSPDRLLELMVKQLYISGQCVYSDE